MSRLTREFEYGTVHKSYLNPDGTLIIKRTSLFELLLLLNPFTLALFRTPPQTGEQPLQSSNNRRLQEILTQAEFVAEQSLLPYTVKSGDKEMLREEGVQFFGRSSSNPHLQFVKLPDGWKKVRTSSSEWTHLIDDDGKKRATIYYRRLPNKEQEAYMNIVDI